MNETYIDELERALENILENFDSTPEQETFVIEDEQGGLVGVNETLQNAILAAMDLLYHGEIEEI